MIIINNLSICTSKYFHPFIKTPSTCHCKPLSRYPTAPVFALYLEASLTEVAGNFIYQVTDLTEVTHKIYRVPRFNALVPVVDGTVVVTGITNAIRS